MKKIMSHIIQIINDKSLSIIISLFVIYYFWQTSKNTAMGTSEKLCLQWNDFKGNFVISFGELRADNDFTDITLACEDGKQVEAHKVILASASPIFRDLLKRYSHPRPWVYI